jgi:hypothetical protein
MAFSFPLMEESISPALDWQGWIVLIAFCLVLGLTIWSIKEFITHLHAWIGGE